MKVRKPDAILKAGLIESGLSPSDGQIDAFMVYLSELKKWNKAYNLTGLKEDEDIIVKHFLDSLLYLKAMPAGTGPCPESVMKVADIGSGAGFPGIPLKIIRPETEMYLIEPSGKKSAFLVNIITKLGMDKIKVIEKRIEDVKVSRELSSPVDAAVTRALFSVNEFKKKASHIVKQGGTLILNKGPKVREELKILRDTRHEIFIHKLPLSGIKRYIVVIYV